MTPVARFRLQLTFTEAGGATAAMDERRRKWAQRGSGKSNYKARL